VAGKKVAVEEGAVGGLSAALAMGYISGSDVNKQIKLHQKRLHKIDRFRKMFDEISCPRAGLYELANDDTVVCRCEEVTLGQIKDALAKNTFQIKDLKRMTRLGMGSCEGRMCAPSLIEMMRHRFSAPAEKIGYLMPRPTIRPVSLGVLAGKKRL
jgi:NAD(P)H-nitrite reductase large subunit